MLARHVPEAFKVGWDVPYQIIVLAEDASRFADGGDSGNAMHIIEEDRCQRV
jgi:hypothetical protein